MASRLHSLPSKYRRIAERLEVLAEEGRQVAKSETQSQYDSSSYIQGENKAKLETWLTKTDNVLRTIFGESSAHMERFRFLAEGHLSHAHQVVPIVGVIEAAHDDLVNGFLASQEFLIASEVFDSVLDQARHLNETGYKDPAAVLVRVVLEDALRRIARDENVDDTNKASRINDDLKKAGRYSQPQWRQVQAWLDLGNSAAHGQFEDYTADDVKVLIEAVERFLANELAT
jgi:hypothetical protein